MNDIRIIFFDIDGTIIALERPDLGEKMCRTE